MNHIPKALRDLRINPQRMWAAFDELAQIGATVDGGVHRPTFSEAHLAARQWFREQIVRSGLEFHADSAGNHSAVLDCGKDDASTLLLGSHLDSVPNGGRFDGALGVVAALEVLRTIQDAELECKVNLEAIDFTDEEGTLVGFLGSAALTGNLQRDILQNPRGGREALIEGMARAGLSEAGLWSAVRPKESLAGYLELHVEQAKRLESTDTPIGIVSAIFGIWSYRLSFLGRADHAGSTPMRDRLDASLGASEFNLAARDIVINEFRDCMVNIGRMDFLPGVFNIVPAQVDISLEIRSPDDEKFKRLDSILMGHAREAAQRFGLELKIETLGKHSASLMDPEVQNAIASSCEELGLAHLSLPSGAGHDGQSFDGICPVGMIFVPSKDGASHSPREFTLWEDCVNGANVLLQTVLRLAV